MGEERRVLASLGCRIESGALAPPEYDHDLQKTYLRVCQGLHGCVLKAKIQASLRRESRPKLEWFSRVSLPLAYAAAVLIVSFAVPWPWRTFSPTKDQELVAQAISNYVRSLIAAHLADVTPATSTL